MSKQAELISFIENLTEEQVAKIMEHLPLLKQLVIMTDNELIYSKTFLQKLFSRAGEGA